MMRASPLPTTFRRLGSAARLLAAAALLVLLAGCLSRSDSLAPMISITEPKSGTTRSTDTLVIVGYAMDDQGVAAIRVDGKDLLQSPEFAQARGKSLVHFGFRGVVRREGEITYAIEVEDVSGRVTKLDYSLAIDTTPPTLELTAEPLGQGRYRLSGTARDNTQVSAIRIGGSPLSFAPAPEVAFEFSSIAPDTPEVEVVDSAGNRIVQNLP